MKTPRFSHKKRHRSPRAGDGDHQLRPHPITTIQAPQKSRRGGESGAADGADECLPAVVEWEKILSEWPPLEWPDQPIRPKAPSLRDVVEIRLLAFAGTVAVGSFFVWMFNPDHRGDAWLFWPLALSLAYNAVWWLMEWSNYARPKIEPFRAPRREWTVDILTTACPGEPSGMILRTLLAMKAIRYPHTNYLCDEGDDPVLREACRQLGITHVTRGDRRDAKAGNINNALQRATGEIAVVLDPDHEPSPYFLDRVLGNFEDPGIGFVQSVQAYRNQDANFIANGAAKQTYLFYGPIMIGLNAYGATQAVGANCAFRRAALDSIGGHAAGLSEDMHTTMLLYAAGWRSVYVPEVLTRGLVPETLPGYCKQQQKWACGSMDLLLHVYPRVFTRLTIWQKLHYFVAPLYFMRGLVALIDVIVPIICLAFGGVALHINMVSFLGMYAPAFLISTIARQVAQRWSIEPHERGTHMVGFVLGFGCWWSFLRGILCALWGIRLPYIPTEKMGDRQDCWGLAMPNLIAAAACMVAIAYGLSRDWSPYNFCMAGFAVWGASQLLLVAAIGQQRTLEKMRETLARIPAFLPVVKRLRKILIAGHARFVWLLREEGALVALPVIAFALYVNLRAPNRFHDDTSTARRDPGGFYVGVHLQWADGSPFPASFEKRSSELGTHLRLFPVDQQWAPGSEGQFPAGVMREARRHGAVPLITWLPAGSTFPQLRNDPELSKDRGLCKGILNGEFDGYLTSYIKKVRDYGDPVLIRFAPKPDNPLMPWSAAYGNSPAEYVKAWIYVNAFFSKLGVTNVGWVWTATSPKSFSAWYPGDSYVDWIGLAGAPRNMEFADFYGSYREAIAQHGMPVMLADFDSADPGWTSRALAFISQAAPDIHGLVLSDPPASGEGTLSAGLAPAIFHSAPPAPIESETTSWHEQERPVYHSPFIAGDPGHFALTMNGQPFYVRGIAYNPGHDWRDGDLPLTRRELESDFASIQRLGANTIRRYGGGWYDRNLLAVAEEKKLRVLYGFWFEPDVDYASDRKQRALYEAEVENGVRQWKDQPGILAWSLGNEVWGLLKLHYAQPYLTEIRHAEVDFVEHLAERIHEIDPAHPVFTANQHDSELPGALDDYSRGAPSLDFTSINSYYDQLITTLRDTAVAFDPNRPYLISEFGPDGYWDKYLTKYDTEGAILEPPTDQKMISYARDWSIYTEGNRGADIGGVAYCWRDRLEKTTTWFGLHDVAGLPKPSFFTLEKLWTGSTEETPRCITRLVCSAAAVAPGATVHASVETTGAPGEALRYRWQLASNDFDLDLGRLHASGEGSAVDVTVPATPGSYRLYVNVSDGHAADEANLPITVEDAPSAQVSAR